MRILVDLKSHVTGSPTITEVTDDPAHGAAGQVAINGRFAIPVPSGTDFPVDSTDYVLNGGIIDGGDVSSRAFAHLLAMHPMFGNIYFNPLLTDEHVGELDLAASFKVTANPPYLAYPRFQTGRDAGGADDGQMPCHTALLPSNNAVSPTRPGLMITDELDIGPYTQDCNGNEVGTDQFMLYWKLYDFSMSHDIAADYGLHNGKNEPALRYLQEAEQEPTGFSAYITTDGGATWHQAGLLEPIAFCDKTTKVRIAFRNDGTVKRYIACFGLFF